MGDLVVGLDVGTHKICTIVGEVRPEDIYVVGVGIEPSDGMKKGVVNDVGALSSAIGKSVRKAEKSSGYDINRVLRQRGGQPYFLADEPWFGDDRGLAQRPAG